MKYEHKPIIVEAIQVKLDNLQKVKNFFKNHPYVLNWENSEEPVFKFKSKNGILVARKNYYIIKFSEQDYASLSKSIFEKFYDPIDD